MTKRCIPVLILLLTAGVLYAGAAWVPSAEIRLGYYGAVPLADSLKTDIPLRTQGFGQLVLNPVSIKAGRVGFSVSGVLGFVTRSPVYDQTRLKSFSCVGGRAAVSFYCDDFLAFELSGTLGKGYYGGDVRFGFVSASLGALFTLVDDGSVFLALSVPLEVSYRKDILGVCAGVGLRVGFDGYPRGGEL